ncbi:cupin domain-containing protein [Streptomyces marispadix]|uniref:Cupin n=1 Tax=Streptomyces marispadix TaxID=2922868 RepID=A0ABS9SWI3_9ACTN|nr:cupin [Streptomyces marispadix]MCH6160416.1 cupin [Streptomyces marispadix]
MSARLPGGIGLSHISAYDWEAADGVCGGSPHVHLACTEAYVVIAGEGTVQTLTVEDGFTETALEPGVVAWFTPGTVHRMVRGPGGCPGGVGRGGCAGGVRHGGDSGGLRVTVLMQNGGLPEAGDAVFTFPPEVLADPDAYAAAASLPAREGPDAERAARERRDLAVDGYLRLQAAVREGDLRPLHAFHAAAARLAGPRVAAWQRRWRAGALAAAELTGQHLVALSSGDASHLSTARVRSSGPTRRGGYGMCGRRDEYELPGVTLPYQGE